MKKYLIKIKNLKTNNKMLNGGVRVGDHVQIPIRTFKVHLLQTRIMFFFNVIMIRKV